MNQDMKKRNSPEQKNPTELFRLMWDNFPHPVLLLKKNRKIIDANRMARALGVVQGIKCRDISPYPEKCKNQCLADQALASGTAERVIAHQNNKALATYWVPLASLGKDIYLHFVIDIPDA